MKFILHNALNVTQQVGTRECTTVQKAELLRAISRATGIVESTLDQSIKETRDQIIVFFPPNT